MSTYQLIGRWAVNGAGIIGRIDSCRGHLFRGVSLEGLPWASYAPQLLSERHDATLRSLLEERLR